LQHLLHGHGGRGCGPDARIGCHVTKPGVAGRSTSSRPSPDDAGVLGSILALALFLLVVGVGVASIVFATVTAHRWVSGAWTAGGAAATVTSMAALVAVLGGWLAFDFYVAAREGARFVRRRIAAR
jgi:hypothetical protein